MTDKLISIGKTVKLLGVSIDTLRRWDKAGKLQSVRSGIRGHRYYRQTDIDLFLRNVFSLAMQWASAQTGFEPEQNEYCQTRDIFQARLEKIQSVLIRKMTIDAVSLICAVAGEIGNNSFDHNLGNWPDIPGIFFAYDMKNCRIILADRGQGILKTLKRVKPELKTASMALKVAFTETISGRMPEARGNGLKFVRAVITANPFTLNFQTADAYLFLKQYDAGINVKQAEIPIGGCLAVIEFGGLP
jgi:hypothetical protein